MFDKDQLRWLFKHLTPEELWSQLNDPPYSPTSREGSVDGAHAEPAERGGPTGTAAVGKRGGGVAPAERLNLSPAHEIDPSTHKSAVAVQGSASSGELATSGGPAEPAISKYHSSPAHVTEPYQHTPVDYGPCTSTSCEANEDAGAKDGNIPTAESFTSPSRSAGKRQGLAASPSQAVQSAAGE